MRKIGFSGVSVTCFLLVAWTISNYYVLGMVSYILFISWALRFSYSFFHVKRRIHKEVTSNEITDSIFPSTDPRPMCYFLGIFHMLLWLLLVDRLSVLNIPPEYILIIPIIIVVLSEFFGVLGSMSIRLFYLRQREAGDILEPLTAE